MPNISKNDYVKDISLDTENWQSVSHKGWELDRVRTAVNKRPCNQTAFYISTHVTRESMYERGHVRDLNGRIYDIGTMLIDEVLCCYCNNPVRNSDIADAISTILRNKNG